MGFVVAKCQKCGYNMNIDDSLEKGFCPACGTPYIRDQLPKTGDTIAERIKSAEVFFTKLGDKNKALEIFASVTNDAPDDYRGWWGIVRVRTDQFERLNMTTEEFEDIQKLAQNAYTIAQSFSSESVQFQIESIWNTYEKRYNLRVANDRAALTSDKDGNLAEISDLNDEISRLRSQVTDIRGTVKSIQNRISKDADTDKRLILDPKIGNKWIVFIMCIALGLFSFYLMAYIGAYGLLILLAAVIAGIVFWKKISTNKRKSKEKRRLQIKNRLQSLWCGDVVQRSGTSTG